VTTDRESSPLSIVMFCFTAVLGEKLNWGHNLQEAVGMCTALLGMREAWGKSKAPNVNMESCPLSVMLFFTAVIPLLVKSQIGESTSCRNVHRFTGHERGLREREALTSNKESSLTNNTALCIRALLCKMGTSFVLVSHALYTGEVLAAANQTSDSVM
jgi:hypothetical protein